MYRRRFLRRAGAVGSAATTVGLAGCAGVGGEPDHDVGMLASAYEPREITVSVGETVVWENTSARAHTVTATPGGIPDAAEFFASGGFDDYESALSGWQSDFGGILESGDRFEHTFTVPGTYEYVCIPHREGGMYGTVIVEE
ncbi:MULTISPECIES: plastocyanin/azurin family copper-binding protein [Halorubrum]|uniref:Blue (Type 1) copper domain protein n=1 Tax=Halorubrum hochstenium ATCC 700873 TaxID=1227481 RepID=M0FJ36_9EURY|nr:MULTISPECIES: plastocyanin/azurin family copper-binding protein [Halorubrum]ELZ59302.1 blue (type 1) copper domain protein [Halorubrum hochstenium ATCC 700873]